MEAMQAGLPMARIEFLDEVQMRGMNIYNPDMKLPETPHLFLEFHGSDTGTAEQVEIFSTSAAEHGGGDLGIMVGQLDIVSANAGRKAAGGQRFGDRKPGFAKSDECK